MRFKIVLGIALAVVGAVLSLFFWDLEYGWFQGGPLGLLMIVIGVFEVGEELWRARSRALLTRSDDGPEASGGGEGARRDQDR